MRLTFKSLSRVPVTLCRAFSLVEVVVAVGIFAIAIVSIIGLLVPINQSVSDISETDDAGRVAGVIIEELQRAGFVAVKGFLDSPPPAANRLHASRDGRRVGLSDDSAAWDPNTVLNANEEKALQFFELTLTRNATLSPAGNDNDVAFIAFLVELRWPGYSPDGTPIGDRTQQSSLLIPAVVVR